MHARSESGRLAGGRSGFAQRQQYDALSQLLCACGPLAELGLAEAPIHFPPTYRYIQGAKVSSRGDLASTLSPKRLPGWCDRVLFRGPVEVRRYDCLAQAPRQSSRAGGQPAQ